MRYWLIIFGLITQLAYGQEPFLLIPNNGQWHEDVYFKSNIPGGSYYIDKTGFTYHLYDGSALQKIHNGEEVDKMSFHAVKVVLEGAQTPSEIKHYNLYDSKYNYFLGNDKSKWAANLKGGDDVLIKNIYPGIDIHYSVAYQRIKYEFIVHPNADPNQIKLKVLGADSLQKIRGNLKIFTTLGEITDAPPLVYQEPNLSVNSNYYLIDDEVTFELGPYDKSKKLIIDPEIVFSSYSGSSADNFGFTATYDEFGFMYAGGTVYNDGYPTTTGAYDINFNNLVIFGLTDLGISKYDTSGTFLIYSTYIGGSRAEAPHSMIVNENDELYIFGTTSSENYPTTDSAYQTQYNGGGNVDLRQGVGIFYQGTDIFVTKLSNDGSDLLGSTYLGGSEVDGLNLWGNLTYNYADQTRGEIILSSNNQPIIASTTYSLDFPITAGAIQSNYLGSQDGIITQLNQDLSEILWSTYLGGDSADAIYSIEASSNNKLYVAGGTVSSNFHVTDSFYQNNFQGGRADGFMSIIEEDGSDLFYSSYFGTDAYDQIYFIRTDKLNNAYIFGQSEKYGTDLIFNATYNIPNSGQFITKFNPDITQRTWSTTFGSGNSRVNISPTAFTVDLCNRVYLSGWGSNSGGFNMINFNGARGVAGMEVTPDAFQGTTNNNDFYMMVLEDDASSLSYASFFGGTASSEHVDGGTSRFDRKGNIYQSMCAGCRGNSDMPIHPPNAHSPTNNSSGCNNGVLKFDFDIPSVVADFIVPEQNCDDYEFTFQNTSNTLSFSTFTWDFGDGNTSVDQNPTHEYDSAGVYEIKLIINDSTSCNSIDSITKVIELVKTDYSENLLQEDTALCANEDINFNVFLTDSIDATYNWFQNGNAIISQEENIFDVEVGLERGDNFISFQAINEIGCEWSDTVLVRRSFLEIELPEDSTICFTDSIQLTPETNSLSEVQYIWEPNYLIEDTTANSVSVFFNSGEHLIRVRGINEEGCLDEDSIILTKPDFINNSFVLLSISEDKIFEGEEVTVTLNSSSNNVYWYPILPNSYGNNEYIFTPSSSTYIIAELTDEDEICFKSDSVFVEVVEIICGPPHVFVPNAFSPNNDGENDFLFVRGENITNLYFAVFNRWGQKVFETTRLDEGWDGFYKGMKADPAVYDYYLQYDCNGEEQKLMKGNVTLIR